MISWESMLGGNSLREYAIAAGLFVALIIVFRLVQYAIFYRVHRLAAKTATDIDDTLIRIIEKIRPPFYIVLALWVAVRSLALSTLLRSIVDGALVAVLVYQAIVTIQLLVQFVVGRRLRREQKGSGRVKPDVQANVEPALRIVNKITAVVLWSVGLLFILSNFGVDVTSLVAGLGVGGIAIALAAQNILGDLFSSLAIYLDKPFGVGDFIIVGDVSGTVTYVGIKTTRLRALSGEEVVLSNRDLTAARIKNLRRMEERRVVIELSVAAKTPLSILDSIPALVRGNIKDVAHARFGAAYLVKVSDAGFIYEVVYHVTSPDYHVYREVQQAIILNLLVTFSQAHITLKSLG